MTENFFGLLIILVLIALVLFFYIKNKKEGKDNYEDMNDGSGTVNWQILQLQRFNNLI